MPHYTPHDIHIAFNNELLNAPRDACMPQNLNNYWLDYLLQDAERAITDPSYLGAFHSVSLVLKLNDLDPRCANRKTITFLRREIINYRDSLFREHIYRAYGNNSNAKFLIGDESKEDIIAIKPTY